MVGPGCNQFAPQRSVPVRLRERLSASLCWAGEEGLTQITWMSPWLPGCNHIRGRLGACGMFQNSFRKASNFWKSEPTCRGVFAPAKCVRVGEINTFWTPGDPFTAQTHYPVGACRQDLLPMRLTQTSEEISGARQKAHVQDVWARS